MNVNTGKASQMDQSRGGVYIHVNTGRYSLTLSQTHTLTHPPRGKRTL